MVYDIYMTKKIYITRVIPNIAIDMLNEKGYEVDVYSEDRLPTQEELILALKQKNYDAVISLLTDIVDKNLFDLFPSIKLYANYASGYNNIDIVEAKKRNITITNTPGNFAHCIAEHTMALILGLTTRLVEADKYVRDGKYTGWSPMNFIGTDLQKKIIGIIGAGRIGESLANIAFSGFNMDILYYDTIRNENIETKYKAKFLSIDELLKVSDIVSLHLPLLDSSYHLINADRLKLMKKTSFLINTARGPIVDELALVQALKDGNIRGAGLDVFEYEPKLTEGLTELPNVILTPHIASARENARLEMAKIVAENVISFLETGKASTPVTV